MSPIISSASPGSCRGSRSASSTAPPPPRTPRRCPNASCRSRKWLGTLQRRPGHEPVRHERPRSEEHTSELQSLMRISYAVFCLKKKQHKNLLLTYNIHHRPP